MSLLATKKKFLKSHQLFTQWNYWMFAFVMPICVMLQTHTYAYTHTHKHNVSLLRYDVNEFDVLFLYNVTNVYACTPERIR